MKLPKFLWWLPVGPVKEIEATTFKKWLDEGREVQIVDARTGVEYRQGTIGGADHAPVTDMPGSIERLHLRKDQPVVVLCASGHRSRPGTRWLRSQGYESYSLAGGIIKWRQKDYPLRRPEES